MPKNKVRYIVSQMLLWSFGWFSIVLVLGSKNNLDSHFWQRALITFVGTSLVVFVNLNWLLPNLYLRKKRVIYVLSCILLLTGVVWGMHSDKLPWNQEDKLALKQERPDKIYKKEYANKNEHVNIRWLVRNLPPLFICLLGSSLLVLARFVNQKEKETVYLEKLKLETEIKFLKAQINPHFLFNSLHNIYALTIVNSDEASVQLLKLSDILRYMLYDSNEESVNLEREIECLKSYLGLVKLKDSRGMDIHFEVLVEDMNLKVAPLLFIPFVENAFKHSQIEDLKNGFVHVTIKTNGRKLNFTVINSKPKKEYQKDKIGGIGLVNIKQRLSLLYSDEYELKIEETENTFLINLELNGL